MLKWTGAVVVGLCVLIAAPGALAQQDSRKALRQRIERKRQEARERLRKPGSTISMPPVRRL